MPRTEPTTPSRRRAARASHSSRPPPKLARTAASVAAAAAASVSFPPPLTSTSASTPPLPTTTSTKTQAKTPKKSKKKDTAPSTPAQTWRHPAELPYIRSPSGKHGTWDDMTIVRFLVANAGFSIPGRSASSSSEKEEGFFQVHFPAKDEDSNQDSKPNAGEAVTLPTPYRLSLLWTAKYLWTSLHLVLTADPAIRDAEWRETRFEILHLARLIDVLLSRSPIEHQALSSEWRCPPFDRALRRFWHHWLISRDEFVRDFWREFGEEEFEDGDVLGLAWPRWVLKGHKGFLLTKAEVANGIDVQGFLRGFSVDEEKGEFGYPEADKDGEDAQVPPARPSESKSRSSQIVEGGGGEEEDGSKTKSKKKVVKKPKSTPLAQSQDDSDQQRNATRRKSSPEALGLSSKEIDNASLVESMLVDAALPRSPSSTEEEIPLDPPLPRSTTTPTPTTPRPPTSREMYIEVPPLAADDPRKNIGRRPAMGRGRAALSSTAMGSVRPGTGRVVGFVGAEDGEKSEDGDENAEEENGDGDVNMEVGAEEEEGIVKGEEEVDESELDLDSDLELGYPEEVQSVELTPATAPAPNEHEKENLIDEDEDNSEPSLSRSTSPVLPPLSSARFPPPAPTPTIPSVSTPPIQHPPQLTTTPPPPPHQPNPTSDAITHFLHSFTALTTELHALRAEVADLRRSRDLTTPVVLQLEERVRRVEGRLTASVMGNSGASSTAVGGVGLSAVGGESTSAWSHPLAHLVSFAGEEDEHDVMDVDVSQTVVEQGKSSKKRKSAGGASGSGSKKRNTTASGDKTAEAGSSASARKVGRR
ncbi:hypothetical protein R3P38DRAFT_2814369 [Favolaschia claudopus]|uniref:Uncharacterized protein n=1 Tax=Favolaschia claudopus TaxID=2862362 RepID=A0AAV9Z3E3_9AGAR